MFDTMFRLLDLTPLTYSAVAASQNYKRIISIVHPDKSQSINADAVSKAVNHAYKILTNSDKRLYYMKNGKPSPHEAYDNSEAAILVVQMNILMSQHKRQDRVLKDNVGAPQVPVPGEIEDKFNLFLKECREAAATVTSKIPAVETPDPSPSPPIMENKDLSPNPYKSQARSSTVGEACPKEPEVVELGSDTDSDSDKSSVMTDYNPIYEDLYERSIFPDSCPNNKSKTSNKESNETKDTYLDMDMDEGEDTSKEKDNDPPSPFSDGIDIGLNSTPIPSPSMFDGSPKTPPRFPSTPTPSPSRTEATTSPIAKRYVDRGTSPFKPGDPVVYLVVSSSSAGHSRASKKLRFESAPSSVPTPGMSTGSCREDCTMDFSGSSFRSSGSILKDPKRDMYISSILNMRTRSGEVTFRVKWGPGGYECTEKAETVLSERNGLRNWLGRLRFEEPRRFQAVLRFHPEFRSVLNNSSSGSSFDSAGSASKRSQM